MTKDELFKVIAENTNSFMREQILRDAVDAYTKALIDGKPIVLSCKELLIQMQHRNYNAICAEGNSEAENTKAENRFKSLAHVLQMLGEQEAL